MFFRRLAPQFERASMALMLFGILALCQPWIEWLHRYSVLLIILGLVAFNVFSRIQPPAGPDAETETD
jgi:hypothetical protein